MQIITLLNPVTQPHPLPSSGSCRKRGLCPRWVPQTPAGTAGQGRCLRPPCAGLGMEEAARKREIIKTDVDKASAGIFCFRAITESGDKNKMNKVQSVICFSWTYHSSAPSAFVSVSSTGTGALSCCFHPLAQEMFCSGLLSQTASGVLLPLLRASPRYPHGVFVPPPPWQHRAPCSYRHRSVTDLLHCSYCFFESPPVNQNAC